MSIIVKVKDGLGKGNTAQVTSRGQLVTGVAGFSEAFNLELGAVNVAGNIVGPRTGSNFIITDMQIYANRNVGVNDAHVTIYESSDGAATTTETKVIYETDVPKQSNRSLPALNLEVTKGRWVNAITDDDDVLITVMGYFIGAE